MTSFIRESRERPNKERAYDYADKNGDKENDECAQFHVLFAERFLVSDAAQRHSLN